MNVASRSDRETTRAQRRGIVLVICAATLWSSSGLFIKLVTVPALPFTALRAGFAALALAPFVSWRSVRLNWALGAMTLGLGATQLAFVVSTRWTTAANAIALQATAPAWVFLAVTILARRIQWPLLLPHGLIVAGIVAMLSEPVQGTSLQGNLIGLVAGMTFAAMQMAAQRIDQPPLGVVVVANAGGAALCWLAVQVLVPDGMQLGAIQGWEWVSLIYLGAFQIGMGMLCYTAGIQKITVSQGSILVLLEPLLVPVWVYLVLGEAPSAYGLAGFALILTGIVVDVCLRLYVPSLQPGQAEATAPRAHQRSPQA